MTFHCLFEQSGTFKNEFKKLGYDAEDYDILNDFGETDHVIDLFDEIEVAYRNLNTEREREKRFSILSKLKTRSLHSFHALALKTRSKWHSVELNTAKKSGVLKKSWSTTLSCTKNYIFFTALLLNLQSCA